jgi:plastocyanin
MTKRLAIIAGSFLIAAGLAAGFSARAYSGTVLANANPAPAATPILVTIRDFAFKPATLTIAVGTTVQWKNEDSASHTATSLTGAWDTGNLDQGQSGSFTFTKAGSYDYVCNYHPNMRATIVVKDSGG